MSLDVHTDHRLPKNNRKKQPTVLAGGSKRGFEGFMPSLAVGFMGALTVLAMVMPGSGSGRPRWPAMALNDQKID